MSKGIIKLLPEQRVEKAQKPSEDASREAERAQEREKGY